MDLVCLSICLSPTCVAFLSVSWICAWFGLVCAPSKFSPLVHSVHNVHVVDMSVAWIFPSTEIKIYLSVTFPSVFWIYPYLEDFRLSICILDLTPPPHIRKQANQAIEHTETLNYINIYIYIFILYTRQYLVQQMLFNIVSFICTSI
jgi:hypothetical protein